MMRMLKPFWLAGLCALALVTLAGCETPTKEQAAGVASVPSAEGFPIRYEVAGQGDVAVVFVHCWSCNRSFWDAQFPVFAEKYRVVRLDLAGHGESGRERQDHTMAKYGGDVARVVNALGLDKVVLVGHSMGGPVAVEAAKQLGDHVIGVVGVDVFYTPFEYPEDQAGIDAFVAPFEQDFRGTTTGMVHSMFPPGTDPALVDKVVTVMMQADERTGLEALRAIFRWNMTEGAASLAALGDRLRNINGDAAGVPSPLDPSVTLVHGSGHFPHMQDPGAFNAALFRIIDGFAGAR